MNRLDIAICSHQPQAPPTLVIIRTLQSSAAGRLVRVALQENIVEPLAKILSGANAETRAEMIGSLLLGYDMYHRGSQLPGGTDDTRALL